MQPDLLSLYAQMLRSRLLEEAIARLWHDGLISGEMHLGSGEEGIVAGVVDHLRDGDAMALDHRGTAALFMRGVDPVAIVRELLGLPDGLCHGMGGHMHLYARDYLSASSGIVGASGPAGAGFALAAQYLNPGAIAVAFFGEGAMNQGMLMESLNLAAVWALPLIFVCKDDGWSITAESKSMTGGNLNDRARSLGVPAVELDGRQVEDVWQAAYSAIERARSGGGPTFLHARCVHDEAHFLGYQLLRVVRNPVSEMPAIAGPLSRALLKRGGSEWRERVAGVRAIVGAMITTLRDPREDTANDPLKRARDHLSEHPDRLHRIEQDAEAEVNHIVAQALQEEGR